ncbi:Cytochrome P450 [Mycena sanguinolenta]|uniref:Cytochrome P450 n=1 Tax=Mycena sanguinolenta TaxID=230812 RepID=A0A8H7DDU5_9AGAR|nr:Cytochrome P450 [Mycena sanguinolenta]
MASQLFVPIAATLAFYAFYSLAKMIHRAYTSPLRDLPGPNGGNFLIGHFRQVMQDFAIPDKWCEEFGANYQIKSFLNTRDLYTIDIRALNHILTNDHIYQKGPVANSIFISLLGNGKWISNV